MKQAIDHKWKLVIGGVDRSELGTALCSTPWNDYWPHHASPVDDDDPYTIQASIPIEDMDSLIVAIKAVGHLRADYGIVLYCDSDFGEFKLNVSLCQKASGYRESSSTFHRTVKSLEGKAVNLLTEAERALSELRDVLAALG
jgi:hypothetical protein